MTDEIVVAVTGVSGFLGQRLLPLLDASPHVDRIVGLDVRDPARRARKLEFHRVDVLGTDLTPYLARRRRRSCTSRPRSARCPTTRCSRASTSTARGACSTPRPRPGCKKIVRPSSTAVYGAWANNPVPITEDAPLRPSPGYLPAIVDGECERLLAEWAAAAPGRVATRLRIAPIVGGGARSLLTAVATGRAPVRVRGATPPVQVVHVDDAAAALELATAVDLDGAYNVAADGWLTLRRRRRAASRGGRMPALPVELAARVLAASGRPGSATRRPRCCRTSCIRSSSRTTG